MNSLELPYNHPAFPKPADTSVILWRYMDDNKFEWLVKWRRIFMPSADRLGDPAEGTTPNGELKWWERAMAKADSKERQSIIKYNRNFLSRMASNLRGHYYVSCWHMNQYENHAMWQCYTSKSDALAIQTTFATLKKSLPNYVEIGLVRYINYATDRLPTMNLFEYIMHKDSYYSFECEVRAVAFCPPVNGIGGQHFRENHYEKEDSPGFLVYAPPINISELIHSLVLHPETSPEFESKIKNICNENGLPLPMRSRKNRKPVF